MVEFGSYPEQYGEFLVGDDPDVWVCMDDREPDQPITHPDMRLPYNQTAGGAVGIALNFAIVGETQRLNSISNQGGYDITHLTRQLAGTIKNKTGVTVLNHYGCAAQQNEARILNKIKESQEPIFKALDGQVEGLTESRMSRIAKASGNLALSRFIPQNPKRSMDRMLAAKGKTDRPPVGAIKLADKPHAGSDLMICRDAGISFDTTAANKAGKPAYFTGTGNLVNLLKKTDLDHNDSTLVEAVELVRHTAIAMILENPEGENLDVHVFGGDQ